MNHPRGLARPDDAHVHVASARDEIFHLIAHVVRVADTRGHHLVDDDNHWVPLCPSVAL